MEPLTILYLFYTFVSFYFLFVYALTYFQNRDQVYEIITPEREYPLSVVVPCYNEAESIGETIEALLAQDYAGLKKIVVVDDCSKDNSYKVIKEYAEKHEKVIAVQTPANTGKAAGAKNYGAKFVDTEFIAFSDADSFPKTDAVSNMVGYFNDTQVGAVTSRVLVANRSKRLGRIQSIEYKIIAFTRKLLGFLESIYVTNGPLSIYRMKAFKEVDGFDEKNLTEDIEITWHFVSRGWKIHMAIPAKAYTVVPERVKDWFKQRIRWNVGGIQTVAKYRKKVASCGMLGYFILPFFVFSWFLGITGLFFLLYRLTRHLWVKFLVAQKSLAAEVALIQYDEIILNPSILFFFGMVLFTLGMIYTLIALWHSREDEYKNSVYDIFLYSIFYLLMYPPLLIWSFYKYLRGKQSW